MCTRNLANMHRTVNAMFRVLYRWYFERCRDRGRASTRKCVKIGSPSRTRTFKIFVPRATVVFDQEAICSCDHKSAAPGISIASTEHMEIRKKMFDEQQRLPAKELHRKGAERRRAEKTEESDRHYDAVVHFRIANSFSMFFSVHSVVKFLLNRPR